MLAAVFGQFSYLWTDLCRRFGLEVHAVDVEWGKGVPLEEYEGRLAADKEHRIKAVLVCQNETARGVTSDVAGVRRVFDALGHPALLFVDGVSSIASIDFRMDEWRVDVAFSGSQKSFMLPTGLGMTCVSRKALEARKTAALPRCFFDWDDMIKTDAQGYFRYGHAAERPARLGRHAGRGGAGERLRPPPAAGWQRPRRVQGCVCTPAPAARDGTRTP